MESGINQKNELNNLYKDANKLILQIRKNMHVNKYKNPDAEPDHWINILNKAKHSFEAMTLVLGELQKLNDLTSANKKIKPINEDEYLNSITQSLNTKHDAVLPDEELLFEGDDSWLNELKPTDKFELHITERNVQGESKQVGESILNEVVKEITEEASQTGRKVLKYTIIGTTAAGLLLLAAYFIPEGTGGMIGKLAGKLTIFTAYKAGNAIHHVNDAVTNFTKEVGHEITPLYEAGKQFVNQTFTDLYENPDIRLFIDTGKETLKVAKSTIKIGYQTTKATTKIMKASAPIISAATNSLSNQVSAGGSITSGLITALGYPLKLASFVGNNIKAIFKSSNK